MYKNKPTIRLSFVILLKTFSSFTQDAKILKSILKYFGILIQFILLKDFEITTYTMGIHILESIY